MTGGSQGLGAAIARQFADTGAAGIAIVRRSLNKGEAKAKEITDATGVPVIFLVARAL